MNKHINGYALALFSIAKENNNLKGFKDDSLKLIDIFNENKEYLELMSSNMIAQDKKKYLINIAFNKINIYFKNLLFVLMDKHNLNSIIAILKKMINLINKELKISEGIIYTKQVLDKKILVAITKKVSTKLKKDIFLVNKTDKTIILGFRIEINNEIIQDTIESRFDQMKEELFRKVKV